MMMRLELIALPFVVLAWAGTVLAEPDHASVNRALADAVIMPAYVSITE